MKPKGGDAGSMSGGISGADVKDNEGGEAIWANGGSGAKMAGTE